MMLPSICQSTTPTYQNGYLLSNFALKNTMKSILGGRKPKEVIATGGQNNQLTLNYIHSPEVSGENITLRIVANPKDAIKVCE